MSTKIHPTAIVGSGAELGSDVEVGAWSIIDDGARVGDGTRIEPFVHIYPSATIGAGCRIHEHAVIGGEPQDHDFAGERSYVVIGDGVIVRENVTINRATGDGGVTSVGSGTMIMEGCHLGHNVKIGEGCTITNMVGFAGHVEVGDFAVVGGMTGFHQFVKVGAYAMVGGMSRIVKDVPPFSLVVGAPARVRGLNIVGLRRRGFTSEQRAKIKRMYRVLYDSGMSRADAVAKFEEEFGADEHGAVIVSFLKSLKRGLTRWVTLGANESSRDDID